MTTPSPSARLLVVDDEPDLRTLYELTLVREGHDVETAANVEEARQLLASQHFDVLITDMRLPDGHGLDLLRDLEAQARSEKVIMITAYGSAENAVEALKAGAFDYLTKPVDLRQFRAVVAAALASVGPASPLLRDLAQFKPNATRSAAAVTATRAPDLPSVESPASAAPALPAGDTHVSAALARLVGQSEAIAKVRSLIEKVARSMAPVLLRGESGTGKELVARAIHDVSARRARPFVAVNCGAIPEQLLEAEFFGYRKGAFTGAQEDREGFFQAAQGGTLFLDEIGDLPLSMQSKLLRAIQERAVRPVGAVTELPVDVRILSASHKNLGHEVQAERFRQDLFYRLNVIELVLPALRDRLDDLPLICQQVLRRIAHDSHLPHPPALSDAALNALQQHTFPGNVRELENILHRAMALSAGQGIDADDLGLPPLLCDGVLHSPPLQPGSAQVVADGLQGAKASGSDTVMPGGSPAGLAPHIALPADIEARDNVLPTDLAAHLDHIERDILVRALEKHRLNRTAAGASLGLSLRQIRYRMARLGVQVSNQGITLGEAGLSDGSLDEAGLGEVDSEGPP